MRIGTSDIILYHLDNRINGRFPYSDLDKLSTILGRSRKTLINHISGLKGSGYIEIENSIGRKELIISENGKKRCINIKESFNDFYLTRERHGISKDMRLTSLMDRFKNQDFKTFFLSLVLRKKKFDLASTLKGLGMIENDTTAFMIFEKPESIRPPQEVFSSAFYNYTYIGGQNPSDDFTLSDCKGALVHCETLRRKGEYQNALGLYKSIISRVDITSSIWFMANIGVVYCLKRMQDPIRAISHLKKTEKRLDENLKKAYLKAVKADIFILLGDVKKADRLFRSSISTFEHYKHPLLLFIGYNNWGILRYNSERYDEAKSMWKKARTYANEARSDFAKALVLCNLSSLDSLEYNLDDAWKKLKKAESIYNGLGDLEGLSLVEYNKAIFFMESRKIDDSFQHYIKSFQIASPLPFELERNERIRQFNVRMMRNTYIGVENQREKTG
jgi:tetratricopeptide (TPR) repeat protein